MAQTQSPPEDGGKIAILILRWIVYFFPGVQLNHPTLIASLQKHCIKQSVPLNRAVELLSLLTASYFDQQLAEEQYGQEALAILRWLIAEIGITELTPAQYASLKQRFEEANINPTAALTLIDEIIAQAEGRKESTVNYPIMLGPEIV